MPEPTRKPRQHGCLFYGGITAVILLILLLLGVLVGLRMARKMVNQYTDPTPVTLPSVSLSAAQMDAAQTKWDAFRDGLRSGKAPAPLVLSGDEINGLIERDPDLRGLKGKVYVALQENQFKGQVSVPMDQLGLPFFHGRYLNGTGTFAISLDQGMLSIAPQEVTVKGKPLPEVYLEKLRGQNLARNLVSNPRAAATLSRLQSIEVKDGKLVITAKP